MPSTGYSGVATGVSMESADTLPKGYPWVGYTIYVQCWSEYPWNLWILCPRGIHGLAILCMSNVGESIHGIHGYFAKRISMGWPYYVCPTLVKVSVNNFSMGKQFVLPYNYVAVISFIQN